LRVRRPILATLQQAVRAQLARRTPAENTYLLLIPAVGALTGVAALAIAHLMALLQHRLWGGGGNLLDAAQAAPWWLRLLVPALGGAAVGLISRLVGREVRGGGTAAMVQALALRGGHISFRQELPAVAAGMLTVSTGGALGREGPMIDFAAALGSRLGRLFALDTKQVQVLLCCGTAAAISAVYNAPIGGTILVMEILIGRFALEIFGPVVIASVISTLIFRGAMGNLPRFVIPTYELISPWELVGYLALGVLCGAFAVLVIKSIAWATDAFAKLRRVGYARPVIGFTLLGAIGIAFPYVYGNGYETVNLALHEQLPLYLLLALPLVKLLATAITRGSGGSGGIFTPTLMMGALVGGAFGYVVHAWFPAHTAEYGAYSLVGMGALVAGVTHAPIMAIMMIFEQTNSYPIILPLMLVCIVSNLVARRLKPEPLHLDALRRRGVVLPRGPEAAVMKALRVADLMHDDLDAVKERDHFNTVVDRFLARPRTLLCVTDDGGHFVGAISLHAIKDVLAGGAGLEVVIAADLAEPFDAVTPDESLADVMERFWRQHAERLPVLRDRESRTLVGGISQRDLIGIYSQEILGQGQLLARFTAPDGTGGERESYVELPPGLAIRTLVVPSALDSQTIRDLTPRSAFGVHVLQIARYDAARGRHDAEQPGPDSALHTRDRLLVIGPREGLERFERALDDASAELASDAAPRRDPGGAELPGRAAIDPALDPDSQHPGGF
jgi:CIC family chloride channel protein